MAACEAVRVLGNLSRSTRAARYLVLEGALDALPPFQEHGKLLICMWKCDCFLDCCSFIGSHFCVEKEANKQMR